MTFFLRERLWLILAASGDLIRLFLRRRSLSYADLARSRNRSASSRNAPTKTPPLRPEPNFTSTRFSLITATGLKLPRAPSYYTTIPLRP